MSGQELPPTPDAKPKKSLDDLMDPNRPIPAEYGPLIKGRSIIDVTTTTHPFAKFWTRWLDFETKFDPNSDRGKAQNYFREHLHQGVLIDLGGGPVLERDRDRLSARPMADLAKACDANTYINVDTGHHEPVWEKNLEGLCVIETKRDLLDFVAHVKNGSASFTINGIEAARGSDPSYFKMLQQEIVRATRKGGIIFGFESDFNFSIGFCHGKKPLLKLVDLKLGDSAFLYEKIE